VLFGKCYVIDSLVLNASKHLLTYNNVTAAWTGGHSAQKWKWTGMYSFCWLYIIFIYYSKFKVIASNLVAYHLSLVIIRI